MAYAILALSPDSVLLISVQMSSDVNVLKSMFRFVSIVDTIIILTYLYYYILYYTILYYDILY